MTVFTWTFITHGLLSVSDRDHGDRDRGEGVVERSGVARILGRRREECVGPRSRRVQRD